MSSYEWMNAGTANSQNSGGGLVQRWDFQKGEDGRGGGHRDGRRD